MRWEGRGTYCSPRGLLNPNFISSLSGVNRQTMDKECFAMEGNRPMELQVHQFPLVTGLVDRRMGETIHNLVATGPE